jgi:hypothetical protein
MLVFSDICRQESRFVLLLSHFGWIITQLEKQCIKLVMLLEQAIIEALNSSGP